MYDVVALNTTVTNIFKFASAFKLLIIVSENVFLNETTFLKRIFFICFFTTISSKNIGKNPKIKYLTNLPLTEININSHKKILMKNTNKLVREKHYQASLNKTGYISESGYNLVFINAYNCNDKKIGVISLNNTSSQSRSDFTSKKLKKYGCLALK